MSRSLSELGAARDALQEAQAKLMAELRVAIIRARASGCSVTRIAKESGVTRQTVYTILNESLKGE